MRGIVAGDVIRRLTARTIAQHVGQAVKEATSPFQYALSIRSGCECVAHVLQALTELDPETTITSIDGISAYETMSRMARSGKGCWRKCRSPIRAFVLFIPVFVPLGR